MALILFDIDGILIKPDPQKYMDIVIERHFHLRVDVSRLPTAGKTQRDILAENLESAGVTNPETDPRFEKALQDVGKLYLEKGPTAKIVEIPLVRDFVLQLKKEGHTIGLITGNVYGAAQAKLGAIDLWKLFPFGAFGDQSRERYKLVAIGMKEAQRVTGKAFSKDEVFVVGDTVRDIDCAQKAGVKSIAVATGPEPYELLKSKKPTAVFHDFTESDAMMKIINGL